ncbi:MAG TPA: GNVR domain-containing protein [Candidatus Binatia bacterium]|jgi:polysaccharide chain length determinant protein (PEP-CTERM system associated)|nr:GNVR domain-containing protein [Candidatus Binatia bacterium]
MQKQQNGWDLSLLMDMLRRRKWVALMSFVATLAFTVSFIAFLPDVYTSSALILVEGSQISEDFLHPIGRMPMQQRLYSISQQALSRSRLDRLSEDFHLYEDLKKQHLPLDEVIAAIRKAITIDVKGTIPVEGSQGGAMAFSIGYSGTDPQKVMDVANTVASFYLAENTRMSERRVGETSDFLRTELQRVKQTLEEQEQKVNDYRKRYFGELPEQRDTNLRTLESLQMRLQLLSENLARTRERRNALVYQINNAGIGSAMMASPDPLTARILELRRQLAELRTRFNENYPDVQMAKQELAALEQQRPSQGAAGAGPGQAGAQFSPLLIPLQAQLKELDGEARVLEAERANIVRDIAQGQERIQNTTKHEQELLVLTRDYNSTKDLYASLLKRQEEANLAGNMEERQKDEQFRILDPATYPEKPSGPARLILFIVALVASLGAGFAGMLLWEHVIDQSFHYPQDLQAFAKAPVVATIPDIVTEGDRVYRRNRQLLGAAAFAASLLLLVGASYQLAAENEQIVIQLGAKATQKTPDVRFQFLR